MIIMFYYITIQSVRHLYVLLSFYTSAVMIIHGDTKKIGYSKFCDLYEVYSMQLILSIAYIYKNELGKML